jgi:hypothetical protein
LNTYQGLKALPEDGWSKLATAKNQSQYLSGIERQALKKNGKLSELRINLNTYQGLKVWTTSPLTTNSPNNNNLIEYLSRIERLGMSHHQDGTNPNNLIEYLSRIERLNPLVYR